MNSIWQKLPDGLDASQLKSLADDTSLEVLAQLLNHFQVELEDQRLLVDSAVEGNALHQLTAAFHTTKGLAATFGLKQLRKLSEELEAEVNDGTAADLPAAQVRFNETLDEANALVGQLLALLNEPT